MRITENVKNARVDIMCVPMMTVGRGGAFNCPSRGAGGPHPGRRGLVTGTDRSSHAGAQQGGRAGECLPSTAAVLHALRRIRRPPDQGISPSCLSLCQ